LVLVPSLTLVDQFLGQWAANSEKPFDYLAVCADLTVGQKREDHAVESTSELAVPPTTNVRDIRKVFNSKRRSPLVVFCTYQSSDRIQDAQKRSRFSFDLVIADEAHRCSTQTSSGLFGTVLDSSKFKAKRRLFMTATPRIFTTRVKKRAKELEYELASMDDESLFGPEFHVLTFDRAIRRGLLADYRVAIIGATNTEMKELAQQGVIVRTRSIQHNAWILAAQIGLAKAMKKYDLRSLITFHSSITKARCFTDVNRPDSLPSTIENMSEDFRPGGQIWSTHISHKMPTSKRKQFLQKLGNLPEKTRGIIGNFACLGEGVDVPALDGVAFIDPKQSQIAIVQAVGRAIRKPDKSKAKTATVVIPVFVEDHDDEESALSSSSFKSVWAVLNALRAHDTRLGEELDQMRLKHRRQELGGKPRLPEKIEIDLPKKIKTTPTHITTHIYNTQI
jgi:predicted helicase